jgi:hypothetical protein
MIKRRRRGRAKLRELDLAGMRVGRLIVASKTHKLVRGVSKMRWLCVCECGSTILAQGSELIKKTVKSCGCLRREFIEDTRHGMSGTQVYGIWSGMLDRCRNQNSPSWANYGGRGITVCERWQTFENFFADMGEPPMGKSIDRIDNNAGYSPENCRWASPYAQSRNMRTNVWLTLDGETRILQDWSDCFGLSRDKVRSLIMSGVDPALVVKKRG